MLKSFFIFILVSFFTVQNNLNAQISLDEVKSVFAAGEKIANDKKEQEPENTELPKEILEKLKSPRRTMQTFLTAMNEIKNNDQASGPFLNEAALTFDLSKIDPNLKIISGRQFAEKLIYILDRIENIDLLKIPNSESGRKWFFRKEKIATDNGQVDVQISIDKDIDGAWRFTSETIDSINAYYQYTAKLPIVDGVTIDHNRLAKVKHFMATWGQEKIWFFSKALWLGFGIIILVSVLIFLIVRKLITWYLLRLSKRDDFLFSKVQIQKISLPFAILAFSGVWLSGISIIELNANTYSKIARFFYILSSLTSIWAALKIVDLFTTHFQKVALRTVNKFDDTLVPMVSKFAKFMIYAFGIVLVAHALTFDVRGLLAGLGLGGIAVALAAKDTIANLFGSVTVILDRPFQIGDYVYLDKSIEGTVEDLGFRSTRIRTPENSLLSIPNSVMANMAIDNYGERFSRRLRANLQVELTSSLEDLDKFCEDLKKYAQDNNLINSNNISVYISEIANKALTIQVTLFILTKVANVEYQEKHKAYKEILKLAKLHNIEFIRSTNTMILKEVEKSDQ